MNLLGSMMSSGSGNMANLATSLVAQALQNKPGGMMIGGNHFPSTGSAFNNSAPRGGGFMDRRGRDDYGVSLFGMFFDFRYGLNYQINHLSYKKYIFYIKNDFVYKVTLLVKKTFFPAENSDFEPKMVLVIPVILLLGTKK